MTEIETATKAVRVLADIVQKVSRFPERVQIQVDAEEETMVCRFSASTADMRALQDGGGRMSKSLELIAQALSKRDGVPMKIHFQEETKR